MSRRLVHTWKLHDITLAVSHMFKACGFIKSRPPRERYTRPLFHVSRCNFADFPMQACSGRIKPKSRPNLKSKGARVAPKARRFPFPESRNATFYFPLCTPLVKTPFRTRNRYYLFPLSLYPARGEKQRDRN